MYRWWNRTIERTPRNISRLSLSSLLRHVRLYLTRCMTHYRFRTNTDAGAQLQKYFVRAFDERLEAAGRRGEDRSQSHIRDITSRIEVRRTTIGAKPSFALLEHDVDEVLESILPSTHSWPPSTCPVLAASNCECYAMLTVVLPN